jgi:hypothetical protein
LTHPALVDRPRTHARLHTGPDQFVAFDPAACLRFAFHRSVLLLALFTSVRFVALSRAHTQRSEISHSPMVQRDHHVDIRVPAQPRRNDIPTSGALRVIGDAGAGLQAFGVLDETIPRH